MYKAIRTVVQLQHENAEIGKKMCHSFKHFCTVINDDQGSRDSVAPVAMLGRRLTLTDMKKKIKTPIHQNLSLQNPHDVIASNSLDN